MKACVLAVMPIDAVHNQHVPRLSSSVLLVMVSTAALVLQCKPVQNLMLRDFNKGAKAYESR